MELVPLDETPDCRLRLRDLKTRGAPNGKPGYSFAANYRSFLRSSLRAPLRPSWAKLRRCFPLFMPMPPAARLDRLPLSSMRKPARGGASMAAIARLGFDLKGRPIAVCGSAPPMRGIATGYGPTGNSPQGRSTAASAARQTQHSRRRPQGRPDLAATPSTQKPTRGPAPSFPLRFPSYPFAVLRTGSSWIVIEQ
jgi:hypothetical protein